MIQLFKKHERGFGSAFVFMVFFISTINHSSANLLFALNLETSDFDTYSTAGQEVPGNEKRHIARCL